MNFTSTTNCPDNETRKLEGEVVPPQSVAGEGSSSAWAGRGAAGDVANATAAANTSRESAGAEGGGVDPVWRGTAEG